jgi:hypothetical protein
MQMNDDLVIGRPYENGDKLLNSRDEKRLAAFSATDPNRWILRFRPEY